MPPTCIHTPPALYSQASVAETNRIRLLLGLKPLSVSHHQQPPEPPDMDSTLGPQLPSQKQLDTALIAKHGASAADTSAASQRRGGAVPKPDEATGAREVLAISLDRYTRARPLWR